MRLRHKPYARTMIKDHPEWVVPDPEVHRGQWDQVFGNDRPIQVEIGMGKGQFIIEMAKEHPDTNFVGIEVYSDVLVLALKKAMATDLTNLRFIRMNGQEIANVFGSGEVDQIYLNFSDPWPKNRHAKRRLTNERFLREYAKVLRTDGSIALKTDNQGFFEYSLCSMSQFGLYFTMVSLDLHHSDFKGNVMTEYEEKFSKKGQPIYRLEAKYHQSDIGERHGA